LPSTLAPAEMHITVVYSKKPMRWSAVALATDTLIVPPMRGARAALVQAPSTGRSSASASMAS
jgi:hypothetical protein